MIHTGKIIFFTITMTTSLASFAQETNATIEYLLAKYKQPQVIDCKRATTKVEIDTCLSKATLKNFNLSVTNGGSSTSGASGGNNKRTTEDILRNAQNLNIEKLGNMKLQELQSLGKILEKANTQPIKN